MIIDPQQERAARELATADFGNDEHWRHYLGTFACASRALHNAVGDLGTALVAECKRIGWIK